ncbi:hypothetical protein NDU88_000942 [Pleurodeles waltl]|uniref:Uncharacterized protein n=1 Tax=Pleurodeles waltl TaxID=8319 RepID=A0AAV7S8G1_PLEWA|nr:hypothetical protein NDU88_000942 [Pleurodeles waltl]
MIFRVGASPLCPAAAKRLRAPRSLMGSVASAPRVIETIKHVISCPTYHGHRRKWNLLRCCTLGVRGCGAANRILRSDTKQDIVFAVLRFLLHLEA